MDFTSRSSAVKKARALYDQSRIAAAAQEDKAAFDLLTACVQTVQAAYETADLDLEETAEILEVGIEDLAEFHEQLVGAMVRQAFIDAARAQRPDEAFLHVRALEEMYRLHGDEGMSFDQFCGEMGVKSNELADLKVDISRRQVQDPGFESGGAKLINVVVGASLRKAFRCAAEYAKTNPARALKIINAMEWIAGKIGDDRQSFYRRAGLDAGMIANLRSDVAPRR
jgi:hypothetical protein